MLDLLVQIFSSIGEVKTVHTVVDYYTYIKGLEYLICVGFFVGFPMYYRYVNHRKGEDANSL